MSALALYNVACKNSFQIESNPTKLPLEQMRELYSLGYHLIPCGGDDGKKPLRKGWNNPSARRMPLKSVITVMQKADSCTYGIRLDGLAVVDCDTWNDETRAFISLHFPCADLQVRSSRGAHLYFRSGDTMPGNFRSDSVQIDFKQGCNHFVVGPGSIRPDGRTYQFETGELTPAHQLRRFNLLQALPSIRPKLPDAVISKRRISGTVIATQAFTNSLIKDGKRNGAVLKCACSLAYGETTFEQLQEAVTLWVQVNCENPESFSAAEIEKTCKSAWRYRLEGRLYRSAWSEFRLSRQAMDLISSEAGHLAGNCFLLYAYLQSNHGHNANKHFAIVAAAIAESAKFPLSKSTIDRCKQKLRDLGLIKLLRKGRHMEPDFFILTPLAQIGRQFPQ